MLLYYGSWREYFSNIITNNISILLRKNIIRNIIKSVVSNITAININHNIILPI